MQSTKIHRPPGDALLAYIMVCSLVERNISCNISRQDHMKQPCSYNINISNVKVIISIHNIIHVVIFLKEELHLMGQTHWF